MNRESIRKLTTSTPARCIIHRERKAEFERGYQTSKKRPDSIAWYPVCAECAEVFLSKGATDNRATLAKVSRPDTAIKFVGEVNANWAREITTYIQQLENTLEFHDGDERTLVIASLMKQLRRAYPFVKYSTIQHVGDISGNEDNKSDVLSAMEQALRVEKG